MKVNNEFTLDHKQGYWVVGLMKTSEDTGNSYLSATKTYPTLEKATCMLLDNNVDSNVIVGVANRVYTEYQLEQSRLFFVDKQRAADRNAKRKEG